MSVSISVEGYPGTFVLTNEDRWAGSDEEIEGVLNDLFSPEAYSGPGIRETARLAAAEAAVEFFGAARIEVIGDEEGAKEEPVPEEGEQIVF